MATVLAIASFDRRDTGGSCPEGLGVASCATRAGPSAPSAERALSGAVDL
jgi:hypothetical protein